MKILNNQIKSSSFLWRNGKWGAARVAMPSGQAPLVNVGEQSDRHKRDPSNTYNFKQIKTKTVISVYEYIR